MSRAPSASRAEGSRPATDVAQLSGPTLAADASVDLVSLAHHYGRVRARTEALADPLAVEDYVVQSMPDVSPTKWHLAHVTWFFETFVLMPHLDAYEPVNPAYQYLFNSYYLGAGERHCRDQRGYISRPTVAEVYEYRRHVDGAMERLLVGGAATDPEEVARVVEIGLHHEQQHQELLLTDIKHVLSVNPLRPAYHPGLEQAGASAHAGGAGQAMTSIPGGVQAGTPVLQGVRAGASASHNGPARPAALPPEWVRFPEGLFEIGAEGDAFTFDNERPRHRHFVEAFDLASRPVTNGEYMAFITDGGYQRGELWLSEGWATAQARGWTEPFYWEMKDGVWWTYTLSGAVPVAADETACHLTYFEADAYARWAGARLPSEQEWEVAAQALELRGNMADSGRFHPEVAGSRPGHTPRGVVHSSPARSGGSEIAPSGLDSLVPGDGGLAPGADNPFPDPDLPSSGPLLYQMFGDVWEWTRSQYSPYPGYQTLPGTLGEYNGKFMSNQFVLRGGSCVTPDDHVRSTYRNFFPADAAWQFSGVRLARDAK